MALRYRIDVEDDDALIVLVKTRGRNISADYHLEYCCHTLILPSRAHFVASWRASCFLFLAGQGNAEGFIPLHLAQDDENQYYANLVAFGRTLFLNHFTERLIIWHMTYWA